MKNKVYIININSLNVFNSIHYDSIGVIEIAKKMLLKASTYKVGSIDNTPIYVSEYVPENEVLIVNKGLDYPTEIVFSPIEKT